MKRILKIFMLTGFICTIAGTAIWMSTKYLIAEEAESKAKAIAAAAVQNQNVTDDEKIVAIATEIFKSFHHQDPAEIPLYRFRPYLTNHRLPDFIRLPDGVIETHLQKGYCDNAARMLAFALKQEAFDSVQWNMVSPHTAHSALLVTLHDGRKGLVDPFYGYVAVDKEGKLIHPQEAQTLVKSGLKFEEVFKSLGESSNAGFYSDFQSMSMAAEGENLVLETNIPLLNGKPFTLGQIDSDDLDVKNEGTKHGLNPFWHYMGHKYNREWVRVMKATEPVRVIMTLVAPVEEGVLIATPEPTVNGNTLSWKLKPGESITFKDGDAKISFARMNSYIGVDQILFTAQ